MAFLLPSKQHSANMGETISYTVTGIASSGYRPPRNDEVSYPIGM
jgi:hypothetical protein